MTQVTDDLLDHMVQAIVAEVDPEQVILFGSRARGDAREDIMCQILHRERVRAYHADTDFAVGCQRLAQIMVEVETGQARVFEGVGPRPKYVPR